MKYGFSLKGGLNTTENNIRQNMSDLVGEERRACRQNTGRVTSDEGAA